MSWQPEALGGPVLAWEMKRVARGRGWRNFQIGYCAWLMIQALAFLHFAPTSSLVRVNGRYARMDAYRAVYAQQMEFLDNYLVLLLQYQLVLVLAVIPAITAISLGQE